VVRGGGGVDDVCSTREHSWIFKNIHILPVLPAPPNTLTRFFCSPPPNIASARPASHNQIPIPLTKTNILPQKASMAKKTTTMDSVKTCVRGTGLCRREASGGKGERGGGRLEWQAYPPSIVPNALWFVGKDGRLNLSSLESSKF
jgi:hypothetical protein